MAEIPSGFLQWLQDLLNKASSWVSEHTLLVAGIIIIFFIFLAYMFNTVIKLMSD